ncbi:hypothetical protein IEQ34_012519 [Dendrobium chrysotoxum]|uniref:Uncharacterized protein n=1 Tax=Dendrobium chrysotoxum TaxID=161865 RepID=A0AAV7GD66_DENCH|nr:hypothetical protein IEQ34_012519 [Dendrobium chrysotoxum]
MLSTVGATLSNFLTLDLFGTQIPVMICAKSLTRMHFQGLDPIVLDDIRIVLDDQIILDNLCIVRDDML